MEKRERGTGSIYLRGRIFWMQYYVNGKAHQESTGTANEKRAIGILNKTLADVATGKLRDPQAERSKVGDLVAKMFQQKRDGIIRGAKSLEKDEYRWKRNLAPVFASLKAQQVTRGLVERYVNNRKASGAGNGTVNKEISILRRAFDLAEITGPRWPRLPEENVRRGYLEDAQYAKLAAECAKIGLWLRTLLALGVSYGWRKGEMRGLRVRQVDLLENTITLEPGTTKNGEGRTVTITDELRPLLSACITGKNPNDFVLTRDGKPIGDFRKSWARAFVAAGVPLLTPHDLRRTGARNLRRLGVAEGVIMRIGGWKTRHVFERYNIVSTEDMAEATRRLNAKHEQMKNGLASEPLQNRYNSTEASATVDIGTGQ